MKKNIFTIALTALAAMPAMAQETYESAQIATEDLNGTARYVGMGGAMEALGADISTMSTNPAGIALMRSSSFSTSFGFSSNPKSTSSNNGFTADIKGKSPMSFDQMGFVINIPNFNNEGYFNIGFNYHKSRNFNEVLSAANSLGHASQNKGSFIKGWRGLKERFNNPNDKYISDGFVPLIHKTKNGSEFLGYANSQNDASSMNNISRNFSQSDYLLWNVFLGDETGGACYNEADGYCFSREQKGYVSDFEINFSGNHNDRIYWGLTIGVKDVRYYHWSYYTEYLNYSDGADASNLFTVDERKITGTGWNIKGGVIIRPIAESPFRFGLNVSSPTWYELTSSNYTTLYNNSINKDYNSFNKYSFPHLGMYADGSCDESIDYKVFTPWKFGASLGHTFGSDLALGLSYEYADYGSIDNRIITDEIYDYWDDSYRTKSESDKYMNANTKKSLKGVHTLKVGFESNLTPEFAVRAGYNYVSPMYSKNGVRSTCLDADGCYYTSTTDYTNWKDTNRVTVGLGYKHRNFSLDLAYQYSVRKGDFYPFESMDNIMDYEGNYINNIATATEVKAERHQLLMTLGWKF